VEGSAPLRSDYGGAPAGKPTAVLNASFSGYDYKPARNDAGRHFLLDDYGKLNRSARNLGASASLTPQQTTDSCWSLFRDPPTDMNYKPKQQMSKFGSGFMRRQQKTIEPYTDRVNYEEERARRLEGPQQLRTERLVAKQSAAYNGFDVITGADDGRAPWQSGKKRVPGYFANASGDDAPAGRLYDGTWRFFATQGGQREPASHRVQRLEKEGLFHTTRTSTVIGVGPGSSEIPSKGVRENFNESHWAIRKREAAAAPRSAADAADIAAVRALQ